MLTYEKRGKNKKGNERKQRKGKQAAARVLGVKR